MGGIQFEISQKRAENIELRLDYLYRLPDMEILRKRHSETMLKNKWRQGRLMMTTDAETRLKVITAHWMKD